MSKMIIMRGISYSGKSTFVKNNFIDSGMYPADAVVCPDQIRLMVTGDISNQSENEAVFFLAHRIVEIRCRNHCDVIWDATNPRLRDIVSVADHALCHNMKVEIVDFDIPSIAQINERMLSRRSAGYKDVPMSVVEIQQVRNNNGRHWIQKWVTENSSNVRINYVDPEGNVK